MKYQIDQSGKIEDTNKITIIAYANGTGLIYLLLKDIKIDEVIIDKEYPGKVKAEEVLNLFNQKKVGDLPLWEDNP